MRRVIAALITVAVFGAVLWIGRGNAPPASKARSTADTPDDCIQRMFEAAVDGDVETYVDCFRGAERQRLERELEGERREAFARSLTDAVSSLRGRAVFADGPVDAEADRARYSVDRVYESRTERQIFELVRESGTWRIESVRNAQPFQPETPYGSPVYETPAVDPE